MSISKKFLHCSAFVVIAITSFLIPSAWTSEPQQSSSLMESEVKAASEVTGAFLKELGGVMKREMKKGDPSEVIHVCSNLAPEIANRLSRENGWRVTRVGTRVRNPLLGMPDAWEQGVLKQFTERARDGEKFADMAYSEVVSKPRGRYFRFMKPIGVQPQCLLCHGDAKQIPASIRTMLKKHYPFDAAIGYKTGELRGAVSIKEPLGG